MVYWAQSGHIGGSFSCAEIMTMLYFGGMLRHDPANPRWPERDRFILSKAHCVPILYAALAQAGYFPLEELRTFRQLDSRLQGHVKLNLDIGCESSGGSLGQGLSWALGEALAGLIDGLDYRVYCLLGDGELDEGQVWEAAMAAAHHRVANLIAIIDHNGLQNDDTVKETMQLGPLAAKWRSFGWRTVTIDGHDFEELHKAFAFAQYDDGRRHPTAIIAKTVKGKGVSFMEDRLEWHATAPTREQYEAAIAELEGH